MQSIGAVIRKAFIRPLEKSPKQPGALDWLVWKLFFSRWDVLFEQNPRLAREMYRASRSWFQESPLGGPPPAVAPGVAAAAPSLRSVPSSGQMDTEAQTGVATEYADEAPSRVSPMAAAKERATTSRLRQPRQNPQNAA